MIPQKEYGGYLPLELHKNKGHYYSGESQHVLKVNSGLTAIYVAIKHIKPRNIYVPYFICKSVIELLKSMDCNIEFYHINGIFSPINVNIKDNDCIIIVNYFGVCDSFIKGSISNYKKVIIDNTQAFFNPPVLSKGVYNVYSTRKFIGVSDGGYLISKELIQMDLEKDYSTDRYLHLLRQYETGTDSGYSESKKSYHSFYRERRCMSALTDVLLQSVDYEYIKKKRLDNFNYIHNALCCINQLEFEHPMVGIPYSYPLFLKRDIRNDLIHHKVYVPTLWGELLDNSELNSIEKAYITNICHLPIDQRYDKRDMDYLTYLVQEILDGSI